MRNLRLLYSILTLMALTASAALANQAPIAHPDGPFTIHNNGSLTLDVLQNDSDPDPGDSISLIGPIPDTANPPDDHATVTTTGQQILYQPHSTFVGQDTFRYRITDGSLFHSAVVTVNVTANGAPVAINDPSPNQQSITVNAGTMRLIDVLANDRDPDITPDHPNGDPLTLIGPIPDENHPPDDHATITVQNQQIEYQPHAGFTGFDTFRYRINDGALFHAGVVTVQVLPTSGSPVLQVRRALDGTVLASGDTEDFGTVEVDEQVTARGLEIHNEGTTSLSVTAPPSLSGCSAFSISQPLSQNPIPPQGSASFYIALDTSTADTYSCNLTFTSNATPSPFTLTVTGTVEEPPGIPNCSGPGPHLNALADLIAGLPPQCNGMAKYNPNFPNNEGSCGHNEPVLAAAYTLIADPSRIGPSGNGDVLDWWVLYLRGEMGMRGAAWHFGGTELLSGVYESYFENAVMAVHYHARKRAKELGTSSNEGKRYSELADLAQKWLRATFALQATVAVPKPAKIYDDLQEETPFGGNPGNQIQTYIALAGERYEHGIWNRQLRSMIFERAVQRPGVTFNNLEVYGQRTLLNYIESHWSALEPELAYGPYGLTTGTQQSPKEREMLASIKGGHALPPGFSGYLKGTIGLPSFGVPAGTAWRVTSKTPQSKTYQIIGWDGGYRLSFAEKTISQDLCKTATPGKVYFPSGGPLGTSNSLYVLYPYKTMNKTEKGTTSTTLDRGARRIESLNSRLPLEPNEARYVDEITDLPSSCGIRYEIHLASNTDPVVTTRTASCSQVCLPPTGPNLLGHWDFESAGDLGLDSSGSGRNGTSVGLPSQVTGRDLGEKALQLSGANHIEVPALGEDLQGESALTVEAWIKVPMHTQTNVFRSQQPAGLYTDRLLIANYTSGTGWYSLTANPTPPVGQWYHLAGVFDQGAMRIYINGQLAGSQTVPFTETAGSSFATWALGARHLSSSSADQHFVGEIDDVKVYTRVLSAAEIRRAAEICP